MKTIKQKLAQNERLSRRQFDLFLCSSSFEERCMSIPKALNNSNIISIAICKVYKETESCNYHELKKLFENKEITDIEIHPDSPLRTLSNFQLFLSEYLSKKTKPSILIDITTFTHESLLILFKLLILNLSSIEKIEFCYNDASEYSINESCESKKWLTKGVGKIRNIIGYPGYNNPARKNHLLILFGFEIERTQKIIEQFEADYTSIGVGCDKAIINSKHSKINEQRHKILIDELKDAKQFSFSLIEPDDVCVSILKQIEIYNDTNIIISPMNTKLSTLGVALAAERNSDIQLCYVQANQYNVEGYSRPGEYVYFYEMDK